MKTGSYVYILCSSGRDLFPEMTAVSLATLRMASPHARIVVLVDRQTSLLHTPGLTSLREAADEFKVVDCPDTSPILRSRFLKCGARHIIAGPIVYLDSDTLVLRSPDEIWDLPCDVAACPDLAPNHRPYLATAEWLEVATMLGWTLPPRLFLNGGVIYFADTLGADDFANAFMSSWREFVRATGKPNDQLAFNRAVEQSGARVAELPQSYNAQISMNPMAARGAKVIHYFTGGFETRTDTIAHVVARRLKTEAVMDTAALQAAIVMGHPWTRIDTVRKAIAAARYRDIARAALGGVRKKFAGRREPAIE